MNKKELDEARCKMQIVFQDPYSSLNPRMRIESTIMEPLEHSGRFHSKAELRDEANRLMDLVGVDERLRRSYPHELDGGRRQRVGIARAYCNDPKVMLMDEPFGHLDAQTRYMMEEELEKIWQKEKRTVVFVTNNIEEAVYLADRIILLTNCPTTIKKEYAVDLPRPRSYVDPEFLRLRKEILDNTDETL